jgi:hypothetical protein
MGRADYYKSGDYNSICDYCGRKFKFSALRKTWDGFYNCKRCWEPRQPQDFVRGVKDVQAVPVTRPESTDVFVDVDFIDYEG